MAKQYLSKGDMRDIIENPVGHDIVWPSDQNKNLAMSFTKVETFEQCPRKYRAMYYLKTIPYVETPALKWGNAVHKALENYVLYDKPLPKDMKQFTSVANTIINRVEDLYEAGKLKVDLFGEQEWAMDLTGRHESWFGKNVFFRGKADVGYGTQNALHLVDYKTGKGKYPKPEQLEILALLAVAQPNLEGYHKVVGLLAFLETGKAVRHRTDVSPGTAHPSVLRKWQQKALKILDYVQRDYWPENPGPLCGWCDDTDCPHNTRDERLRRQGG